MTALDQAFIKAYTCRLDLPAPPGSDPASAEHGVPRPHLDLPASAVPTTELLPTVEPSPAATEPADGAAPPTAPDAAGPTALRPRLQVDEFRWPRTCSRLLATAGAQFERVCERLLAGQASGQKVVGFAGCQPGDGCTTLLLCLARRLVERGHRVAVVEADWACPQLAHRLGVAPQSGWEAVAPGKVALEEVLIESTDGRLVFLPLCPPGSGAEQSPGAAADLAAALTTLAACYDLVLVDLGSLGQVEPAELTRGLSQFSRSENGTVPFGAARIAVDAVLLVQDPRRSGTEQLAAAQRELAEAGVVPAGILQNFVRDESPCTNLTGN